MLASGYVYVQGRVVQILLILLLWVPCGFIFSLLAVRVCLSKQAFRVCMCVFVCRWLVGSFEFCVCNVQ